jgi:penicillin-binding protein 1A
MHKIRIKRRRPTNSKEQTTTKKYNIKERVNSRPNSNIKIAAWLLFVLLMLLTFLKFGLITMIAVAFFLLILIGIFYFLKTSKTDRKKRKLLNAILIILLSFGILIMAAFAAFLVYITISAPKFDPSKLDTSEVSRVYDKDGNEIAKLGSQVREKVKYDQLPEVLVDAIVATEDSRFFEHNGFDAPRFFKAALGQVLGRSDAGGASTLSMQVVKNSFTSRTSTGIKGLVRKFTDIYLAVFKLEKKYTKKEIIEFYANNHFLGDNVYGVEEASERYFGKHVSELNLSEASIIAGMFKSPQYYRPNVNPKNATARRKTVLYLMRMHGYITKEEEDLANAVPVESLTIDNTTSSNEYQGYLDTVVQEVIDTYKVNPYTTSLKVYTNMDKTKQDAVNKVLNGETYSWINDQVQTGVAVLDSATGKIEAIGAGRNRSGILSFNNATQISRQPGSTAKPLFDYGPGIEYNNWSTYGYQTGDNVYHLFLDTPYSYSNGTSIKDWDGGYYGAITLRRALSASRNIPALRAFQMVDNKKIISFVESLGITPEVENGRIHEAHSIGAFTGVSPLQMAGAYAAFSNGGYYNKPYSVSKIVFRDTGEEKSYKEDKKQVMSDATAYMITSVLQGVALTGGTPSNVACKTGTTNFDENTMNKYNMPGDAIRDSWVIGYSTKTVIGMWYGYSKITDGSTVLRNIPATIQKDHLFLALVNSGAMESDRGTWTMPSSVVSLSYGGTTELFKKGYEPASSAETDAKLNTPGNVKASYDSTNKKVTISWSAVDQGDLANMGYGTFGYNVYQGDTLLGFTSDTSYTYATGSPYATYKVVATYKGYSGANSDAGTYSLKETVADKITGSCSNSTTEFSSVSAITSPTCTVTNNGKDLDSSKYTISETKNTDCDTADADAKTIAEGGKESGTCTINYSIKYNSTSWLMNSITYTIKA